MNTRLLLYLVSAAGALCLARVPGAAVPKNLAAEARLSASSQASPEDGKYGVRRLADGRPQSWWASADAKLPQWVRLEWPEPREVDTVTVAIYAKMPELYAAWQRFTVELSDGTTHSVTVGPEEQGTHLVRFAEIHQVTWVRLTVLAVHQPRHYVGIEEMGVYLDRAREVRLPTPPPAPQPREAISVLGGRPHPTVYLTPAHVARARRNAEQTAWGRAARETILREAAPWLKRPAEEWLRFLPPPGACYAYGFTGCPICGASWGTWGSANCAWDRPGTVQCAKGHVLPDAAHPDDGTGYRGKDGRVHYFVGSWNAWVTEQWQSGISSLAHAYALTGDERYAERAAFLLDALASIYAESTAGSWDYPSSPPSGRLARPWYQVARTLTPLVEAYDLIYASPAVEQPSLRPRLERSFPPSPTPQQRVVGTQDARGTSREGMTRRENIDVNLMQDGGYYCYANTFSGALHNGHADYLRGALAVGALLNIPTYVHHAVDGPYSIRAMLVNNCDRDGRYYETSLGYALHCRELYLTFAEPLKHWRDERYPNGVDLYADARFRAFYSLPDLTMDLAGHHPNFGDEGPDHRYLAASDEKYSARDYQFAEHLYAGCSGAEKERFGQILAYLAGGDLERARLSSPRRTWLLYHAEPLPASRGPAALPADLHRKVFGSWFLGQKGLALLRDGSDREAQGVLLRYGPSLNHGHLDDLGLIYYAKGWQTTYEIGYGLGSTHTQVGWARQTASHALVTVNEAPQAGGSGGSLYLFVRLPGIKVVEADSPLSYAAQQVTQYRRTVALIGEGRDQYVVDLFRVAGGKQHDYVLGSQGQEFTVAGVALGPEEAGSLAGPEHAWGERQGSDGDLIGFPNRPYWNPPPGNGYGFFYGVRRAPVSAPWSVDWTLGGPNQAHLRAHVLPEGPAEAIVAKAPGLYPGNRKASYLLLRRAGPRLQSSFATVLEPYAVPLPPGTLGYSQLLRRVAASRGELVAMHHLGAFLLRGRRAGDFVECRLPVPRAGEYEVQAEFYRNPSYGTVQLSVDGKAVGKPYAAAAAALEGPVVARFGRRRLSAGDHRVRVTITEASPNTLIGIVSLGLVPVSRAAAPREPRPILARVERLPVAGDVVPGYAPLAIHVRRGDRDEYFASQVPTTGAVEGVPGLSNHFDTPAGRVTWAGGIAYVALRGKEVVALALQGCRALQVGSLRVTLDPAAHSGRITAIDRERNLVTVDALLPTTGLEGEGVYFAHPDYSRNTAYRIERIERDGTGSRLHLGAQSTLLGQGRIADCVDAHTLTTEIPHDYARSVLGGGNNHFFDGKRLESDAGVCTRLTAVEYGTPMTLRVESTNGFQPGDVVRYYDIQEGDTFTIPTAAWLARGKGGVWRVVSSTAVQLTGVREWRAGDGAWVKSGDGRIPATGMAKAAEAR